MPHLLDVEDPSFSLTIDHRRIVCVRVHSGLTPAILDRFWSAFDAAIAESRRVWGHGKVMVDRRGAPILTPDIVARVRQDMAIHYAPDDRLAMVVDSTPLKAQVRQNYELAHMDAFLSRDAALAWMEKN